MVWFKVVVALKKKFFPRPWLSEKRAIEADRYLWLLHRKILAASKRLFPTKSRRAKKSGILFPLRKRWQGIVTSFFENRYKKKLRSFILSSKEKISFDVIPINIEQSLKLKRDIHLLIPFWIPESQERLDELVYCLERNTSLKSIDTIFLFWESAPRLHHPVLRHPKIRHVHDQSYPTFNALIEYANTHLQNSAVVIANTDIFFDDTLDLVNTKQLDNEVLALTRHNFGKYLSWTGQTWARNYGSQDAWVFASPLKLIPDLPIIKMGWLGCDGLLAYELKKRNYAISNPSASIKSWHVHQTREVSGDKHFLDKSYFSNREIYDGEKKKYVYVPIEHLGPWEMYILLSPSHTELLNSYFLPSLKDSFNVHRATIGQQCEAAEFYSQGWVQTVLHKIPIIMRAIETNAENSFFIFSDADIQFFRPIKPILRELLSQNPHVDIFFIKDAWNPQRNEHNLGTGFFVCKANERTKIFWQRVGMHMMKYNLGDQASANSIWRSVVKNITISYLPDSFFEWNVNVKFPQKWEVGDTFSVPQDICMHHANWTVGIENKKRLLEHVDARMGPNSRPATKTDALG